MIPGVADLPATALRGRLAENVMHFARVLRAAGLSVGPASVLDAIDALAIAGVERREDWYAALACIFVKRREHRPLFDQAFYVFWRDPALLEQMMRLPLPQTASGHQAPPDIGKRLAEAMLPPTRDAKPADDRPEQVEIETTLTFSTLERLQHLDFESMSGDEWRAAKALIARLRLPIRDVPTRRLRADPRGARLDLADTLRKSIRMGGDALVPQHRSRTWRQPPLVVLCDISGSMHRYTRMFLHFLHAIARERDRLHVLLFGTRLTNITRQLRQRDVDRAVNLVASSVQDWAGGTRIGPCIREFNRRWSRRLLGQNAVVLLISDGLDRDDPSALGAEMERLHKSCRELIWLNPLLRFEGFEARPAGIRAMLPHVDRFLPVHNLESLQDLAAALSAHAVRREEAVHPSTWLAGAASRSAAAWLAAVALACIAGGPPAAQAIAFDGDAIREPLTATPGDPVRGKAVLVQREKGHCILCHGLPEADVRFAGNVGPPLAGVARRLSSAQIRGRIADPTRHDPETVMPAYFRTENLRRVAPAGHRRTVLSAQDVEDAVAYLSTLQSAESAAAPVRDAALPLRDVGTPRSGVTFNSADVQRLQGDDASNPGMLWVGQGEQLWREPAGAANTSCADCHGEAAQSMRGVAARYPVFDAGEQSLVDVEGRINQCRVRRQRADALRYESEALLALTAYVARQSRGMPIATSIDGPARPHFEAGRASYLARQGQLNLSCAQCHDRNWGRTLLAETISQGQSSGYPAYRFEWQTLGSLQRRLRACQIGIRAEQSPFGSQELLDLELYLAWRARGLPVEAPGVRR